MNTEAEVQATIAVNRRRYEELWRQGQAHTQRSLPALSARPAAPLDAEAVRHRETIPGGWYWATNLRRGEALRIATPNGPAAAAMVAWVLPDTSERLNYADTVKIQWTAALGKGRLLYSDMGRVMFSIVEDSCGAHDAIAGGSTPDSVRRLGGNAPRRNTRDNFRLVAGKHGLSRRDVPPCISFFAPVWTDAAGSLRWAGDKRQRGDFVDLRAEMDLLIALSNCPHPLDPAAAVKPPPIEAIRFEAAPAGADDLCRTATAEAVRAFESTDALAITGQQP